MFHGPSVTNLHGCVVQSVRKLHVYILKKRSPSPVYQQHDSMGVSPYPVICLLWPQHDRSSPPCRVCKVASNRRTNTTTVDGGRRRRWRGIARATLRSASAASLLAAAAPPSLWTQAVAASPARSSSTACGGWPRGSSTAGCAPATSSPPSPSTGTCRELERRSRLVSLNIVSENLVSPSHPLTRSIQYVELFLAVAHVGAIIAPLNYRWVTSFCFFSCSRLERRLIRRNLQFQQLLLVICTS
jgi:hypothetical protein